MTLYLTSLTALIGLVAAWANALPEDRLRQVSMEEYREHCKYMKSLRR